MSNNILINGALRDFEELSLILQFIVSEIHNTPNSSIDSVRVSTWRKDANSNPRFIEWAESMGIEFILSDEIMYGGPANYFRQMVTLDAGLERYQDSDIVLKSRTDKALRRKDVFRAFIKESSKPSLAQVLGEKLAVEHITMSVPFMAKDMIFLGKASVMRSVVAYSERTRYRAEYVYAGMGPEVFMWLEYAKESAWVLPLIRALDLRKVSGEICTELTRNSLAQYFSAHPDIAKLFRLWIQVFEERLCFLSDSIDLAPIDPWEIDEGTWKYKIGDRPELNTLKTALGEPEDDEEKSEARGFKKYAPREDNPFSTIEKETQTRIMSSVALEFSDIVLLRRKDISKFLASDLETKDELRFRNAIGYNISHRDPEALEIARKWIHARDANLQYLTTRDQIFATEKNIERAVMQENWVERTQLLRSASRLGLNSHIISLHRGEDLYASRKPVRALVYFRRSYMMDRNSLGANHGLGTVLMYLGLARVAHRFLLRAHQISPQDPTAAWGLFSCYIRLRKLEDAKSILPLLSPELAIRAESQLRKKGRFGKW